MELSPTSSAPAGFPQDPSLRATASRGVHPPKRGSFPKGIHPHLHPEGFIPPRGVHPPCIQRGSSPQEGFIPQRGSFPTASRGVHPTEGFIPPASRGVHPPKGFTPICIQRGSSPKGVHPHCIQRAHSPCIQRGSTPQRGSSIQRSSSPLHPEGFTPQRGSPHTDSEGSSLSASRGIHTPKGFIPYLSRGVNPHCIQRGSSPTNPEGFIHQRGSSPLHPEGFIPSEGFIPLASGGVSPPSPSCSHSGSSLVARAQELFQGLRERCSVQVRAGWPGKHPGRLFVRVRRILGSDRCGFPLGRSPSSLWQRSLGYLPGLGNACSPPDLKCSRGVGLEKVPGQAPHSSGFWGGCYVSMLAKLLYYCLYFLPESKYS
ncbi:splicing factor 3A subunit 2-like [Melospiza melodia melodia]|uniref:splicing factor 3A subunit 2-like n=1 Tax=Melospiza melodia melodia TaxID=1914991 RepID=UPI002FD1A66E